MIILYILFPFSILLILVSRIVTNKIINNKYFNTSQGTPVSLIPKYISVINVIGFLSLLICFILSFTIKWWLAIVIIVIYLLTSLIPSEVVKLKKKIGNEPGKRCVKCKQFFNLSYFAIDENSEDGHIDKCVACTQPDIWKIVQDIKKEL